ncbi:hypothetical protein G4B88_012624 [Cannabis sativa]|uniref:Uncharacterized protein n=1 Tax=Cannabis sativa TaxID=3483 RepID=A0A7J6EFP7_CANSA|nr:hypothetical protein G4B88_012624 [Cannabis sativa]
MQALVSWNHLLLLPLMEIKLKVVPSLMIRKGKMMTERQWRLEWARLPLVRILKLRRFAPNVPIVLVGTKLDLRDDRGYLADHMGPNAITSAQGEELRKQIAYIECSSKTQHNVKAVFDTAIKVVLQPQRRKEMVRKKRHRRSGCSIASLVCGGCEA